MTLLTPMGIVTSCLWRPFSSLQKNPPRCRLSRCKQCRSVHRARGQMFTIQRRSLRGLVWLFALVSGASLGQATKASKTEVQEATQARTPTFTFDTVSIREARPMGSHSVRIDNPSHASSFRGSNITVKFLISAAYGIDGRFILDKSSWTDLTFFDVQARSDDAVNSVLMSLSEDEATLEKQHMVQAMLLDRFHFSAHKELRMTSVYELRVASGGPKLREVGPGTLNPSEVEECRDRDAYCGRQSCGPDGCDMVASSYSMKFLCVNLQGQIGAPVLDKTGLNGRYAFRLEYYAPKLNREATSSSYTPVFTAVQDQLGLKLVRTNSLVEYLVVDHIEKPTAN